MALRSKTPTNRFYCRHCGNKFDNRFMADLCFQLDMKKLQFDEPKKPIKLKTK